MGDDVTVTFPGKHGPAVVTQVGERGGTTERWIQVQAEKRFWVPLENVSVTR